jgi:hypothetical protein
MSQNNDLISRSALLKNYGLKNAVKYGNETAEQQHNSYSTLMLYEVADMINDAPAVDAEVVRHGRWIAIEEQQWNCCGQIFVGYSCSECNAEGSKTSNYCPNCGAKMRGNVDASE